MSSAEEEAALGVTAALLDQGRTLHLTALALLVVAAATASSSGIVGAAAVVAAAETWLAIRVGLDARLFARLAEEAARQRPIPEALEALDAGLVRAGLLAERPPSRPTPARIAGAVRLFRWQAGLVVGQAALAALALGWP